ncbi:hypothetical protein [Jatrophihabitans sp.]|jgi:hypothetical protein|uniref:hypothetical protein n=1 Tax=Jatrophihabitans sp. TaxID=1932789 RepID=UPI002F1FDD7E
MRLLAVTVLTALAVTGCASTQSTARGGSSTGFSTGTASAGPTGSGPAVGGSGATSGSSPGTSSAPVAARCPDQLDEGQYNGRQAKPVSGDVTVDWVLRCRVAPQPDGSRFLLTERSTSDPTALLAALRSSDEPRSSGACPMIRVVVPYFALVQRDGRVVVPKIPLTGCGMPQTGVLQALNQMSFEVIGRKRLP